MKKLGFKLLGKKMFFKFFSVVVLIATSVVFGNEVARNQSSYRNGQSQKEEMLFILHAQDGHLSTNSNNRNQYFLTLYNVSKNVTYFTERPDRKAGKISLEKFIMEWDFGKDSFREDKPNAGLVTFLDFRKKGEKQFSDVPISLNNPQYDKKNNRLIFNVQILEKQKTIPTGDLGETSLFIDGACFACRF